MVSNYLSTRVRVALVVALALLLPASTAVTSARVAAPLAGAVHSAVRGYVPGADGMVPVIIQADAETSGDTDALAALVEAAGGAVQRRYHIISAVQALLPPAAIEAVASDPAVAWISLDAPVASTGRGDDKDDDREDEKDGADFDGPPSVFPAAVRATDVWQAGIDGRGVGIAIVDTGVSGKRTDLDDRLIAQTSLARGRKDRNGHGTFVAGVAAGDGEHSDGRYTGIAPGANIIAVKVGDRNGARIGDVIAGLEWIVEQRDRLNIRVANLSFTSTVAESYLTSPLDAAVEQAWFAGVVVVASAGNRGADAFAADHPPGNDPFVITVGAFSDGGTVDPADDYLKTWSSRGVSHDGFAKPDLAAPGSRLIASIGSSKAELVREHPENRVGDYYFRMGGTSASAPVVSGVAALVLQATPGLTPDQVKARLVAGADALAGSAAPRVDAFDAVFGADAGAANLDVQRSLWISPATGTIQTEPAPFDSITWDSITWDSITWDSITWDSITWDSITWDAVIHD